MKILAIETASPPGSIALLDGRRVLSMTRLENPGKTTQQFATLIRGQLDAAGWQPNAIQLVAATKGPGSFTGLRIGVTAAKTYAYAIGAQVAGVNTLELIATQCPSTEREIEAVVDAQRDQLFAARFRQVDGQLQCLAPTKIIDSEEWLSTRAQDATVLGTGLKRIRDRIPPNTNVADESLWTPCAKTLGTLAMAAAERDELLTPMELVAEYYRKSAAEEKIGGP